ncbi:Uncharacterised protein [Yersinia frederiksenii]|nr:Uncharacterised protein [Yersinia frederiksenii]
MKKILITVLGLLISTSVMSAEKIDAKYIADFRALVCRDSKNPEMCEKGANILMHLVNARAAMAANCKVLQSANQPLPAECEEATEVSDYVKTLLK